MVLHTFTEGETTMVDRAEPEVVAVHDYDGYFEALVRSWVAKHAGPFTYQRIEVTAGPYRASALSFEADKTKGVLRLDFYSALRAGFGSLSAEDIDAVVRML